MDIQNRLSSPFSALEQWEPDSHPVTLGRPQDDRKPFWGDDGFTFEDVLDIVNPLQHIPVAAKTYQEATGDTASEGAKLVGGAVFGVLTGGILGLAAALVNSAVRHDTGKDLPEHALALMADESPNELSESVTELKKPAVSTDTSIEKNASISSTESPAVSQHAERVDFFVDDEAARSLHPAERLLAISSHYAGDNDDDRGDGTRQELERSSEPSMQHKVSETYRKLADDIPGQFWGEV